MMRRLHAAGCAALSLLLPVAAGAQPAPAVPGDVGAAGAPPAIYHGREGALAIALPRLEASIRIDGHANEPAWSEAALLTGFSQFQPVDGIAAADSTEVLLFYTAHAIYFAVRAFAPPGTVNATLADRDRIGGDDYVHILLDTFHDRRRALVVGVNPFGVQTDGMVSDAHDGLAYDFSPDFLFDSRGRLTDYGYEIELRVPFKSIRYQSGAVQTWGINVVRRVQRTGHQQSWAPVVRAHSSFLGQAGRLVDLTELKRGLVLDINPTATARRNRVRGMDGVWQTSEPTDLGLNLRWGATANLTANATFNPDFSQVESDAGQVVYDPRQALFYPEKRPFFLDGNENFTSPTQLIYTRRVVQPVVAAKLSGKAGGTNIGFMSAVDDALYSTRPGTGDYPLFNVLRVRRDLGAQSTVGVLYTDRIDGDDFNRVAALDARFVFGGAYTLVTQVGTSFTSDAAGDRHWRPLWRAHFTRSGRDWGLGVNVTGIDPEFRADAGFLSRVGTVQANASPRRSWYPKTSRVEAFHLSTMVDGTWTYSRFRDGSEPNDIKWHVNTTTLLRGGWRIGTLTFVESFLYPEELYANYFIERRDAAGAVRDTVPYAGTHRLPNLGGMLSFATPQFEHFAAEGQLIGGRDDNFDEWSSAWILFANVSVDWRPTDKVRVNARYLEQRYHRYSDGSLVRLQWLPRLKLEYQMLRPLFVRVVGEYNGLRRAALRDDSRTGDPILVRTAAGSFVRASRQERAGLRADWLVSYQPSPGTVLFAGYGSTLRSDRFFEPGELRNQSDGFFLKLSYLLRT
jgi:hypothetical protein